MNRHTCYELRRGFLGKELVKQRGCHSEHTRIRVLIGFNDVSLVNRFKQQRVGHRSMLSNKKALVFLLRDFLLIHLLLVFSLKIGTNMLKRRVRNTKGGLRHKTAGEGQPIGMGGIL